MHLMEHGLLIELLINRITRYEIKTKNISILLQENHDDKAILRYDIDYVFFIEMIFFFKWNIFFLST